MFGQVELSAVSGQVVQLVFMTIKPIHVQLLNECQQGRALRQLSCCTHVLHCLSHTVRCQADHRFTVAQASRDGVVEVDGLVEHQ